MTGAVWTEVPSDWQVGQIKNVAEVTLGKMLQTSDGGDGTLAPYIRAANIQPDGFLDLSDVKEMWFSSAELAYLDIVAGDVVVVEGGQGGYGRSAYVGTALPGYGFQNSINRLRPSHRCDGRYLTYYLLALRTSGFIHAYCNVVSMPHLTAEKLAAVPIPIPPASKQRAIADFLDHETAQIDVLIAEQQRLIDLLRERRLSVISAAVSARSDWIRTRVKHVAETTLGKMLDAGRESRDQDAPTSYVRAADVRADGTVNLFDLNVMPYSPEELRRLDLCGGDILVIEGGATVGRPAYLAEDVPGISFQKTVNRVRVQGASPRFVFWVLLSLYESGFYASYYGSVSFAHLTGEKLREIPLSMPILAEQQQIAAFLDEETAKINTLILAAEQLVELALERRSALITAAVTGQIDVG